MYMHAADVRKERNILVPQHPTSKGRSIDSLSIAIHFGIWQANVCSQVTLTSIRRFCCILMSRQDIPDHRANMSHATLGSEAAQPQSCHDSFSSCSAMLPRLPLPALAVLRVLLWPLDAPPPPFEIGLLAFLAVPFEVGGGVGRSEEVDPKLSALSFLTLGGGRENMAFRAALALAFSSFSSAAFLAGSSAAFASAYCFHFLHPSKSISACIQPHSVTLRSIHMKLTGCGIQSALTINQKFNMLPLVKKSLHPAANASCLSLCRLLAVKATMMTGLLKRLRSGRASASPSGSPSLGVGPG